MSNPRLNPALLLSPVETGYVAYDPAREWLHQLNPIASLLAELSDGSRTSEEIRALVAPLIPPGQDRTIDQWFENGRKVGLLADADSSEAVRELSADELLTVTKKLRMVGAVQAAYVCGKKTVELAPENWDAWYDFGEICQCVGKRDEARLAYETYFKVHPEDGEIAHLLIALADGAPPPRASDQAILHIYKSFAASYDSRMREDLKYVGPEKLMALAAPFLGGRDQVAEITAWLDGGSETFDLIFSSDCLIYFGDLSVILAAAARRLKPGGVFAFSNERGLAPPFHLTDTGRYTHHASHVQIAARKAGLTLLAQEESFLRMEWGEEVIGLYTVLGRA